MTKGKKRSLKFSQTQLKLYENFLDMIKVLKDEDTVLADNAAAEHLKKYTDYSK